MLKNRKCGNWPRKKIALAKEIIEAVQQRPFLYDQSLTATRRQCQKYGKTTMEQWMEVAMFVYGRNDVATVDKVRSQWKTIRDGFVKHLRKRKLQIGLKPHTYEEELQFLIPHICRRESRNSINIIVYECETTNTDETIVKKEQEVQLDEVIEEEDVEDVEIEQDVQSIESFFEGVIQTVRKFKPSTVDRLKQAVANLVMDAEIEELEENMEL